MLELFLLPFKLVMILIEVIFTFVFTILILPFKLLFLVGSIIIGIFFAPVLPILLIIGLIVWLTKGRRDRYIKVK